MSIDHKACLLDILDTDRIIRELDEKAAIQRKREEEAEAKLAAKKAGVRIPERPAAAAAPITSRTDSNERPSGPPRLALAGNKPTWREREAQRLAFGSPQPAPSAPPSDIATSEAQLPRKTGYVPPALRGEGAAPRGRSDADSSTARDDSVGGEAPAKWRPSAERNRSGRAGPPADGPAPRNMSALRRDGVRDETSTGSDSQADAAPKPAPGKYVPVHMRNRG